MKNSETVLRNTPNTEGVETLLGDPKKAIIKFSIPTTISFFIMAIYQLTDLIWISIRIRLQIPT